MSKSESRVKAAQIGVRLSPDEARQIRELADCAEVSPGAFLLRIYRRWRRDNKSDEIDLTGG
jgi:hypothetical protein